MQKKVILKMVGVVAVFLCVGMISTFVLKTHHLRKFFVGCIGLVASIAMYASPLVAMVTSPSIKSFRNDDVKLF